MSTVPRRPRRTQQQRSADTRQALLEGAVRAIYERGYAGATTAVIAQEAGITRGSIIFHFSTRAQFMAEVLRAIFEEEREEYARLEHDLNLGFQAEDWIEMCWRVLSRPSGVAFLEIQMAARSDPELAEQVASVSSGLEQIGVEFLSERFKGDVEGTLAAIRLVVWAIRGFSIGKMILPDWDAQDRPVEMFKDMFRAGVKAGAFGPRPAAKA
ncbi:MAG: TetR/AcrR family transcriptional regulator [Phenylobacterium sp.]|nr:TetR/AcrR family transcriptional regulator [Phenylobacterium sp.]